MRLFVLFAAWALEAVAADDNKKCHINLGSCDQFSPCCNTEGWCGTGFAHCGSTCFEQGNFQGVSCMPEPACKTKRHVISPDRIAPIAEYTGTYATTDFIAEGDYAVEGDTIVLKLSRPKSGTTVYSTRYMQYGRVSAKVKTSRTGGVVSSFILMAKNKDEIDFEWVGSKLTETQTNWYPKGKFPIWPMTNGANFPTKDTHARFQDYAIDWSPKRIQWLVDGKVLRTLPNTDKQFPTGASRFSFGIWDGGSGEVGTRVWAGGFVDWNAPDMVERGYFDVQVKDIKVECYKP